MLLLIQSTAAEFGTFAYSPLKMNNWPNQTNNDGCGYFSFVSSIRNFFLLLILLYYFQFFLLHYWSISFKKALKHLCHNTYEEPSVEPFQIPSKNPCFEYNWPATGHLMGTGFLAAKSKTNDKQSIQWIEINWPDRILTQKAVIFQFFPIQESHPRANRTKIILNHS